MSLVAAAVRSNANPAFVALVFAGIVVFLGLVIWAAFSAEKKRVRDLHANMTAIAGRLGITPPDPIDESETSEGLSLAAGRVKAWSTRPRNPVVYLKGTSRQHEVYFWRFITGSGKQTQRWCAASVGTDKPTALVLRLDRQGIGTTISALFGAKEITIGDSEFDAAWFIRTNQPDYLRAALPVVRDKLMEFHRAKTPGTLIIADGIASLEIIGGLDKQVNANLLEAQLPLLYDLADLAAVAGET